MLDILTEIEVTSKILRNDKITVYEKGRFRPIRLVPFRQSSLECMYHARKVRITFVFQLYRGGQFYW